MYQFSANKLLSLFLVKGVHFICPFYIFTIKVIDSGLVSLLFQWQIMPVQKYMWCFESKMKSGKLGRCMCSSTCTSVVMKYIVNTVCFGTKN